MSSSLVAALRPSTKSGTSPSAKPGRVPITSIAMRARSPVNGIRIFGRGFGPDQRCSLRPVSSSYQSRRAQLGGLLDHGTLAQRLQRRPVDALVLAVALEVETGHRRREFRIPGRHETADALSRFDALVKVRLRRRPQRAQHLALLLAVGSQIRQVAVARRELVRGDLAGRDEAHAGMRRAQQELAVDRKRDLARVAPSADAFRDVAPVCKRCRRKEMTERRIRIGGQHRTVR